jgi:uncharacterized protein (TIGR04551 family)
MVLRRHSTIAVALLASAGALSSRSAAAQPSDPPAKGAPSSAPSAGDNLLPTDASAATPATPATPATSGAPAVDPASDEAKLLKQGSERPTNDGTVGARPSEVYSEDWWAHTRPTVELHGYFRTRGELYHNFSLGRPAVASDEQNLWPQPLDNSYTQLPTGSPRPVLLCGSPGTNGQLSECSDKTQASANLRLRLNPEIHISDNLRILTQVDLLDNLVLGTTPDSYAMKPSGKGATGYSAAASGYNAYAPLGAFATTQGPPTAGVNGYRNSIDVQRAWAEYLTPVGQLRFGRMPSHWGLGMVMNSGDGLDHDYQTNVDRIMLVSGLKSMDLYFGGSWEFVSTGPTNGSPYDVYGGQPTNTANLANVNQWSAFVAKRTNPELQRLKLARNDVVLNGGLYATYRSQLIDVKAGDTPVTVDSSATTSNTNNGFERRGASMLIPDAWLQLLWNKLRLEAELATVWGSIENSPASANVESPLKLRMWGLATQTEYRAVEDKLRVQFGAGWASGDPHVEGLAPGANGLQARKTEGAISTFRFHPSYQVDYIFFRRILTRVEGAYYFRPSVEYDFLRNPNGQKLGGGAAIIWSRASEFIQTPGNKRDLGVELDLQVYYQSKDGSLNDDPNKQGGFYAALQYGVFFPLGGLDYLPNESSGGNAKAGVNYELSTAQTARLLLGVLF